MTKPDALQSQPDRVQNATQASPSSCTSVCLAAEIMEGLPPGRPQPRWLRRRTSSLRRDPAVLR